MREQSVGSRYLGEDKNLTKEEKFEGFWEKKGINYENISDR